MDQNPVPAWAQSSVDPTQVSLTIESLGKVIIGVLAWYLVSKGANPATATNQLQVILDLIAQGAPMVFALWHSCLAIWGIVRKLIPRTTPATPLQ